MAVLSVPPGIRLVVYLSIRVDDMTIFYADDDPEDRELFAYVIAEIDPKIKVLLASDGISAVEKLQILPSVPNIIFFDVNMPLMSGIECIANLRAMERFKKATLILYSTTSSELECHRGLKAGANKFLQKADTYAKTFEMLKDVIKAHISKAE